MHQSHRQADLLHHERGAASEPKPAALSAMRKGCKIGRAFSLGDRHIPAPARIRKKRGLRRTPALGLALALAACAPTGPPLGALAPSGVVPGGVPLTPEHTLSAGDEFEIRFPFAADYNDRVTVGIDGTIAPKQFGSVEVGGLTVAEATARLKQSYAALLKDPQLSITMRRYAPELVYVDGWVRRPGLVRSDIPLTLARALAQAGGVKTGAQTGDILLIRRDPEGGLHTYSVALGSHAGAEGQDPLLKSFDVVHVPQTVIAAVSDYARQIYANVPFSFSFHVNPTVRPTVVVPQVTAPAPAPAPVVTP